MEVDPISLSLSHRKLTFIQNFKIYIRAKQTQVNTEILLSVHGHNEYSNLFAVIQPELYKLSRETASNTTTPLIVYFVWQRNSSRVTNDS